MTEEKKKINIRKFFIRIMLFIFIILILNSAVNIVRILFIDKLYFMEIYSYPHEAEIEIRDHETMYTDDIYYMNTYLYKLYAKRISQETAVDKIDSAPILLKLDGKNFYVTDYGEIVFALPAQMIRKRSMIDRLFMIVFYDKENYLYYSTFPSQETYDNVIGWYKVAKRMQDND